jgi:hypothetical protein
MGEGTREGLTRPLTPFSPAPWAFAAWVVVLAAQFAWLAHAWSYSCRQQTYRGSSSLLYPVFWVGCLVNIGYVWAAGHGAEELSLALISVQSLALCVSVATVALSLRRALTGLTDVKPLDNWFTRLVTLNALSLYAAWSVLSALHHLAFVLDRDSELHGDTVATCLLSLLASLTLSHFLLEVTVLDRYLRHVVVVYPAVAWWLGAVLDRHWENSFSDISRNNLFAFVLLVVTGGLFLVRLVLIAVFGCFRPLVARDDITGIALIPY